MDYKSTSAKLAEFRREIATIRQKMRAAQAGVEPEEVADYHLTTLQGTVRLSDLFGGKTDLILIHNMGTTCPNCTLWADGLNGIYHHLADRAAVVVSSPDPPEVQQRFRRQPRLEVSDGEPPGHDLRRGHGLSLEGRRLAAWHFRVQARWQADSPRVRYGLRARR
jgi:hypothetical protein